MRKGQKLVSPREGLLKIYLINFTLKLKLYAVLYLLLFVIQAQETFKIAESIFLYKNMTQYVFLHPLLPFFPPFPSFFPPFVPLER